MQIKEAIEILDNPEEFSECEIQLKSGYWEASEMAIQALERTRWIPVSERLPDGDGYVLAVFETCLPFVSMYFSGVKKFSCEGEEANPTHWMALPEPPQEVE